MYTIKNFQLTSYSFNGYFFSTNKFIMKTINTLILSGGGVKCISFIGALESLFNHQDYIQLNLKEICSVSGGCFIALMLILKYDIIEMKNIIIDTSFNNLKKINYINFFKYWGLDSGKKLVDWLGNFIETKNLDKTITFKELYNYNPIKFNIIATNLNEFKLKQFNHETTPNLKILDAIRISMTIPLVFTKIMYNQEYYVDGAIINNYPLELYKNTDNILGFKIVSKIDTGNSQTIDKYITNIINCFIQEKEKQSNLENNITICINPLVNPIDFNLSINDKLSLFNTGYSAFLKFFKIKIE